MIDFVKSRLEARRHDGEADSGALVENVLLVAGFAVAAIFFVTWIVTAILNKGVDAANCIEKSNTYSSSSTTQSATECNKSTADSNSFKNDAGYKSRYGG